MLLKPCDLQPLLLGRLSLLPERCVQLRREFGCGSFCQPEPIGFGGKFPLLLIHRDVTLKLVSHRFLGTLLLYAARNANRLLVITRIHRQHDQAPLGIQQVGFDFQRFAKALSGRVLVLGRHMRVRESDVPKSRPWLQFHHPPVAGQRLAHVAHRLLCAPQCVVHLRTVGQGRNGFKTCGHRLTGFIAAQVKFNQQQSRRRLARVFCDGAADQLRHLVDFGTSTGLQFGQREQRPHVLAVLRQQCLKAFAGFVGLLVAHVERC